MKKSFKIGKKTFFLNSWANRSNTQKFSQNLIFPKNTYSPWHDDKVFLNIYRLIEGSKTLVDIYRCYELWSIAKQLANKEGNIIEIGVWRGGTALLLAKAAPNSLIYLCDTFRGVVKAGKQDNVYKGGEHSDTHEDEVAALLNQNNSLNYKILKGIFPEDTSSQIQDQVFKLCHIDVDVYDSAKDIFEWIWPRLIKGGIVVFDDYGFAACEGITKLVNEIAESNLDLTFLYNINGHGILIKGS